jgi:hypothetical protein
MRTRQVALANRGGHASDSRASPIEVRRLSQESVRLIPLSRRDGGSAETLEELLR